MPSGSLAERVQARPESSSPRSRRINSWAAAGVSACFAIGLIVNMCYPTPAGPADNGDFYRIFASFSSGPFGDLSEDQRYDSYYLRYWKLDAGIEGVNPSVSRACFVPAQLVRIGQPRGLFDLSLNAAFLCLLLAIALFISLRSLSSWTPFLSLSVIALVLADADVSSYLNSFYQESGAYFLSLLLVFALHVMWDRGGLMVVAAVVSLAILLSGTKMAYTYSVPFLVIPVTFGFIWSGRVGAHRLAKMLACGAVLIVGTYVAGRFVIGAPTEGNSYHFLFRGALLKLAPDDRPRFLELLDIKPEFAALTGRGVFEPNNRFDDPELQRSLGAGLIVRGTVQLATHYPRAFLDLLGSSFAVAGKYPKLSYRELVTYPNKLDRAPKRRTPRFSWRGWSRFRNRSFHGLGTYVLGGVLCLLLVVLMRWTGDRDWLLFYGLAALGFYAGSLVQVPISVLGNGFEGIVKHHYFANLLFDIHFFLALTGLVTFLMPYDRRRRA